MYVLMIVMCMYVCGINDNVIIINDNVCINDIVY